MERDSSDDLFSEESPERRSKFQSEVQSELKKKLTSKSANSSTKKRIERKQLFGISETSKPTNTLSDLESND